MKQITDSPVATSYSTFSSAVSWMLRQAPRAVRGFVIAHSREQHRTAAADLCGRHTISEKGKSRKLRANSLLHCTNQCVIKAMRNPCFDNKVAMDQIVGKFNTFSGVARYSNKLRMF